MQKTALVFLLALVFATAVIAQDNGTQEIFCTPGKCSQTTQTCADGFASSCQQSCDENAKACTPCTPSCEGHNAPPQPVCPAPPSKPICNSDQQLKDTKDANGCITGYECAASQPPQPVCPAQPLKPECKPDQYLKDVKDANGCITGYECVTSPRECARPSCEGSYDTGQKDASGCPVFACPPKTCPAPSEKPVCKEGEYISPRYDPNGCIVGYGCSISISQKCPESPSVPPCDGRIEKRFDNSGCVIKYDCIGQECAQVITPARDDAGNCKEFSNSCLPPGWRRVDKCDSFNKPVCGDRKCDVGEDINNCHDDCGVTGTLTCPDGSVVQCKQTAAGHRFCEQCPVQNLPQGCWQEKDERGFVRVVCEKTRECPAISQDVRLKCVDQKGIPVFKKDPSGCEIFFCQFGNEVQNPFSGYQQCPPPQQIDDEMKKCSSLGLRGVIAFEGGCKIARCVEEKRPEEQCGLLPGQEREKIENDCKSRGMGTISRFEGCRQIIECSQNAQSQCPRDMPQDAYRSCGEKGGELVVQRDDQGCIRFSKCVARGDMTDTYIEKPSRVPESTELLSLAFKLESLNIEFDKLAKQTSDIAEYYKSAGSADEARFRRVSDMFITAKEKVNEIKNKIRNKVDSFTEDDSIEVKRDLKYLKDVMLKDILYVMLSSSDDMKQITAKTTTRQLAENDCGTDGSCFDKAFRLCKPITFRPDSETLVTITGLDSDTCILKAKLEEGKGPPVGAVPGINPPYEMTCKVKNYALGMKGPEDILPYCEGSMVELIKKFGTNGENAPGVPGKCSGDDCKEYCGRGQQEAKECLENLGPYLPPEAKQGLEMLASGKGGFSQELKQGEFTQAPQPSVKQQYMPQQRIRPDQCEFTDMNDHECADYILKNLGTPSQCKGLTDDQCRKFLTRSWENQRQNQQGGQQQYGGPQQSGSSQQTFNPGNNPGQGYCGDGVCDSYEQRDPSMCANDCGPLLSQRQSTQQINQPIGQQMINQPQYPQVQLVQQINEPAARPLQEPQQPMASSGGHGFGQP
ncbi:MAG: hypothetical protein QMD85_01385 [Candidatus Aenigmarchaeota archaeon]|nr:hypothetical protein [Candidatus Aenigmarchaeota archaeon]